MFSFERQKTYGAGYMAKNSETSQKHKRYDENNVGQKGPLLAKSK